MTIIIFLIIIAVLIFVHEWGHFIVARIFSMRVFSFAIGFQPTLFSWKRKNTEYKINAIPLGGYVRLSDDQIDAQDTSLFENKPWYQKVTVLLAGVFMNVVLAWVLAIILFLIGVQTHVPPDYDRNEFPNTQTVVYDLLPDSPAVVADIRKGDKIIAINDQEIFHAQEFVDTLQKNPDGINLTVVRADQIITKKLVPEERDEKQLAGVYIETTTFQQASFGESVKQATLWTGNGMVQITRALIKLMGQAFIGEGSIKELQGPVGLADTVKTAQSFGLSALLQLTAVLSLNLAVLNLIPLPVLDGGQIVLVIIEAFRRKKFSEKTKSWITGISGALLMILIFAVTVHDIIKLL